MPTIKRPDIIKKAPKVDEHFTLELIEGKIKDSIKFVKAACDGAGKEKQQARDHAKFLVRDYTELKNDRSGLVSRSSAVERLYKDYNEWVAELPEEAEEQEGMKRGAHPKTVKLEGNKKCPKGCDDEYHDTLITAMKKASNYSYDPRDSSWEPDFGKQTGHADGKNWKAYLDAADGAGTKWRLGFSMSFDEVDQQLTVTINYCKIGH